MIQITNKEIREISENIVNKTGESTNNYDAVDDVENILINMFESMDIQVEKHKNFEDCKCKNCSCKKE